MIKWGRILYQPNLPLEENGQRVTGCHKHISLSKNAAKEGMVLLKNDNNVLPFTKGAKLALFGKGIVPHPEPPSHLPPHTIPLGHLSAPAPSILYPASNLD